MSDQLRADRIEARRDDKRERENAEFAGASIIFIEQTADGVKTDKDDAGNKRAVQICPNDHRAGQKNQRAPISFTPIIFEGNNKECEE